MNNANKIRRSFSTQALKTTPPLKLEKVIGSTSSSNSVFQSNPVSGDVFYAAGAIVICYSPTDNIQKKYFKCSRSISCLAISNDGKYLAAGERGHMPSIIVWDIESEEQLVVLDGHKHGIGCLQFSTSSKSKNSPEYLVSVGFKHDNQLKLWNWRDSKVLSNHKIGNKVNSIAFNNEGNFFITAGDKHLKWWYLKKSHEGNVELSGKPASILESHKDATFSDIQIGDASVYCTTTSGVLCVFQENRMMEKWVLLETDSSYSLSISNEEDLLTIGCANGIIRLFRASSLDYITTLPLPPCINTYDSSSSIAAADKKYPACYTTRLLNINNSSSKLLAANYADNTMIFWELQSKNNDEKEKDYHINKLRSFAAHTSCIWDIHFLDCFDVRGPSPQQLVERGRRDDGLPPGSFVTCSADNTIRFWNLDNKVQRRSKWRTNFSKELLHVIRISGPSKDKEGEGDQRRVDISQDVPDREIPHRPNDSSCPRSLAVHPLSRHLACGDRQGLLRVFDLNSMEQIKCTRAHDQEVLTLSFSPAMHSSFSTTEDTNGEESKQVWSTVQTNDSKKPLVLLASAGRDRHIHLYDASPKESDRSNNSEKAIYKHLETLADHSGSVTIVKFTPDGQRLISCGGDKSMTLNRVQGPKVTKIKSIKTPSGTINGLAIDATNKFAVTSGQDKRVHIWNIQSGRHMRAYNQDVGGELYKCDVDPSGMFVAACGFDKTVKILDFFSGDIVGEVHGHGEIITSIKFSPDGRYVVTVAGDGCIFVWKVGDLLVEAMKERIIELYSKFEQKTQIKAVKQPVPPSTSELEDENRENRNINVPKNTSSTNFDPSPSITECNTSSVCENDSAMANLEEVPASVFNKAVAGASKWGQRGSDNYEIFGKKVEVNNDNADRLNQFTLEMTGVTGISDIGSTDDNKLANSLEASDSVNLGDAEALRLGADDDDDDDDELAAFYGSDFEEDDSLDKGADVDGEAALDTEGYVLDRASDRLDALEQQSLDMENWLEQHIRESQDGNSNVNAAGYPIGAAVAAIAGSAQKARGKWGMREDDMNNQNEKSRVQEKAPATTTENTSTAEDAVSVDDRDLFDKSLTSDFLEHQIKAFNTGSVVDVSSGSDVKPPTVTGVVGGEGDELLPPVPPRDSDKDTDSGQNSKQQAMENKVRQSAAVMAQMKERLRVMGVLEARNQHKDNDPDDSSDKVDVASLATCVSGSASVTNGDYGHNKEIDVSMNVNNKSRKDDEDSGDETASESDGETDMAFPPSPPTFELHTQMEKELQGQGLKIPSDQTLLTGLHAEDMQRQGFKFPSDQTLLSGLQAEDIVTVDDADSEIQTEVDSRVEDKSGADDVPSMAESTSIYIDNQVVSTIAKIEVDEIEIEGGAEATEIETKGELDTSIDSLETPNDAESRLQQKMANCKKVVNEMMRLSVQAKQMYKEVRELANANDQELVNESCVDTIATAVSNAPNTKPTNSSSPLTQTQPPISTFSPRRGGADGKVPIHVLEEMEQSFHHLRLSMASISNILDSNTSPRTSTSTSTSAAASDKSNIDAISHGTVPTSATDISSSSFMTSSSKNGKEDVDYILEKYSDRIADMVSEKLSARMSASMSMSASAQSLALSEADAINMNTSAGTKRNEDM